VINFTPPASGIQLTSREMLPSFAAAIPETNIGQDNAQLAPRADASGTSVRASASGYMHGSLGELNGYVARMSNTTVIGRMRLDEATIDCQRR